MGEGNPVLSISTDFTDLKGFHGEHHDVGWSAGFSRRVSDERGSGDSKEYAGLAPPHSDECAYVGACESAAALRRRVGHNALGVMVAVAGDRDSPVRILTNAPTGGRARELPRFVGALVTTRWV